MRLRKYNLGIFLTLIIFLVSACEKNDSVETAKNNKIIVKTENPKIEDLTEVLTLNAKTFYLKKGIVRSTIQGFIKKVYHQIGDEIKAGDLLFVLHTKELSGKKLNININDSLFTGNIKIRANQNGVLSELNFNEGDFVSEGETLSVIINPSSLRIKLFVPAEFSAKIKNGLICSLELPDEKIISAKVLQEIPIVDEVNQTQTFLLESDYKRVLPDNLNLTAKVPFKISKSATTVSKSGLMTNETLDKFWIMKIVNDSLAVKLNVETGLVNNDRVEIKTPKLRTTDLIITEGAYGLPDSSVVKPVK